MVRQTSKSTLKANAAASEDAFLDALGRFAARFTGQADLRGLASSKAGQTMLLSAASRGMKTHPIATVAVGAGLAWLLWSRNTSETDLADDVDQEISEWQSRADAARDAAAQKLSALYENVTAAGHDAAAFAREKAAITADLAQDLADAFGHGLGDVSDEAADRIADARERAYSAVSQGITKMRGLFGGEEEAAVEDVPGLIRRHPIASVAVAVALGAALAAALQANRKSEGRLAAQVGETAGSLLERAREVFDRETEIAKSRFSNATDTLRHRGSDAALSFVRDLADIWHDSRKRAADDVEDAADAVSETLRDTSRRVRHGVKTVTKTAGKSFRKAAKPRNASAARLMKTMKSTSQS